MTAATKKLVRDALKKGADIANWPKPFLDALASLDAEDTAPHRECSDKCAHWCPEGEKKPYRHLRSCRACNIYTLSKFKRRAEVEGRINGR